jgi:hypothetical protein
MLLLLENIIEVLSLSVFVYAAVDTLKEYEIDLKCLKTARGRCLDCNTTNTAYSCTHVSGSDVFDYSDIDNDVQHCSSIMHYAVKIG